MNISEYITYRRKTLGYTQQQLADLLSVSKQAVNKWEKGLTIPDIMIIPQLANVFFKTPQFITKIIWMSVYEEYITHFVNVSVKEKNGEIYIIQTYESKDFISAANKFREICSSIIDEHLLQKLSDYYSSDPSRVIEIHLTETQYDSDFDIPEDSLLVDSRDLTPIIAEYIKNTNKNN